MYDFLVVDGSYGCLVLCILEKLQIPIDAINGLIERFILFGLQLRIEGLNLLDALHSISLKLSKCLGHLLGHQLIALHDSNYVIDIINEVTLGHLHQWP